MQNQLINFKFYIDRGGTFTDVYVQWNDGKQNHTKVLKLLSVDPANYADAPREAIRRVLFDVLQDDKFSDPSAKFPSSGDGFIVSEIRMGTTVATNALLERKGEPCALVITKGFKDLLEIGYQDRPKIFELDIKKPELIYSKVVEVDERIIPGKVLDKLDLVNLENDLQEILKSGIKSLAVVLMHSYANPEHEKKIAKLAYQLGFTNISLSSEVMPMIKIVPRGDTTLIDAYLTPLIKNYVANFKSGFSDGLSKTNLLFMKSDAGLVQADDFRGANSILSGPAGGVVGYSSVYDAKQPLIGFDMGGTSTDVSRFTGDYEISFFTELDGLRIQAPQLEINTVAAGGGSRLFFENGVFKVGPESAGAHPGPVCYRKNGYLAVTDANLVLGRLVPEYFPKVFGLNADEALDREASIKAFEELQKRINKYLESKNLKTMTIEEIAQGFIEVANEAMARPIREISSMKGYPSKDHALVCFGGAGGQHACALARDLEIDKVIIPKYSGILSAYGISLADEVIEKQISCNLVLNDTNQNEIESSLRATQSGAWGSEAIHIKNYLHLRYSGTNTAFMIEEPEDGDYAKAFTDKYRREFGFTLQDREILVDDIRIRVVIKSSNENGLLRSSVGLARNDELVPISTKTYFGKWIDTQIYFVKDISSDFVIIGPAILMQDTATIVIEHGFEAVLDENGDIVITRSPVRDDVVIQSRAELDCHASLRSARNDAIDPILLSIFSSRFMSIAEQMGRTLEKTAISTNIKERRDFSCAIFDREGNLIANAPHQPVHLGSMGVVVKKLLESSSLRGAAELRRGNPLSSKLDCFANARNDDLIVSLVILTNHPAMGGSHLPDMTVVTPVFQDGEIIFFVANRAHHADIGGIVPGSMPSFSTSLDQEGIAIKEFKIVESGNFQETKLREIFKESRNIEDNISDLRAQVASNKRGIELMQELIQSFSQEIVFAYMDYIQANAEEAVRNMLVQLFRHHEEPEGRRNDPSMRRIGSLRRFAPLDDIHLTAEDHLDDHSLIKLSVQINPNDGSAVFDFTGSAPESKTNLNTPRSVTYSAVLYALRCMINKEIPLNQGCLKPITIIIPENSILNPSENAAVVAGNVQTSQRIVDVILKAFNFCAASQGCMNNVIFGNESFGYYETIGGGAGAGPNWHGASAVHTHMTNTRITDPEILETRYPVILREFSIRPDSGGQGKYCGGNGIIREFEFLDKLTLSLLSERRTYEPYGMNGGKPGAKGENILIHQSGKTETLPSKAQVEVNSGDRFRIFTPGGGGYDVILRSEAT